MKTLPVAYKNNAKAWMTGVLFNAWLEEINRRMDRQNRDILLFVDNCSAHNVSMCLTRVRVLFLPANTTSKLQPLDQGIIENFKVFYRHDIVLHILACQENNTSPEINILQAMRVIKKAWFCVTQTTIANCFKKAGFKLQDTSDNNEDQEDQVQDLHAFDEDWEKITSGNDKENGQVPSFQDFVNVDEDLVVTGEHTDDDIVQAILDDAPPDGNEDDSDAEPEGVVQETKLVKKTDALAALQTLTSFFEQQETDQEVFEKIIILERRVRRSATMEKQKKVTDFFKV